MDGEMNECLSGLLMEEWTNGCIDYREISDKLINLSKLPKNIVFKAAK